MQTLTIEPAYVAADAHDAWFRKQVEQALAEAENPATEWVAHDVVLSDMQSQREAIRASMGKLID